MFNLETAIRTWLAQFDYRSGYTEDDLKEIERHIRDHVAALLERGASPEDAFREAAASFGSFDQTDDEYSKVFWGKQRRDGTLGRALTARMSLLGHYGVAAFRSMRRNPGFSAINLLGLTVGLTVALLTFVFIASETGYDRFHEAHDRIYRVLRTAGKGAPNAKSEFLLPDVMASDLSGVDSFVRLSWDLGQQITVGEETWQETGYFSVDSSFFDVFSFNLLHGSAATALDAPESIVVTEAIARKYFGRTDVVGETVTVNRSTERVISGVAADPPASSHLQFSFLSPISEFRGFWTEGFESWDTAETHAYVRLREGTSPQSVEERLPEALARYLPPDEVRRRSYRLQAITDIHLHSSAVENEIQPQGDIRNVRLFGAIAFLVLLIASVNYVNLATARSMSRAKEAGLRKVVGADRWQLTVQYLGESIIFSLAALVASVVLCVVLIPSLNDVLGTDFSIGDALSLAPALAGFAVVLGGMSGLYPALVQSRFNPAAVLKGMESRSSGSRLRDALVVMQLAVATILIVGAVVLFRQMQFIRSTDLGFERQDRIVVNVPGSESARIPELRTAASSYASVRQVSATSNIPSDSWGYPTFTPAGSDTARTMKLFAVDFDFIDLMDLEIVAGRAFSAERPTDSTNAFILNEAAVGRLGWTPESALGRRGYLSWVDREGEVVGVVKDFHFRSLRRGIEPMVMAVAPGFWWKLVVAVEPGRTAETLVHLEEEWRRIVPGWEFDYDILDERVGAMYEREERLAGLVGLLTLVALVLAGLGLFGLVSFITRRRTREIGVRKILGASTSGLVATLSKEFALLLLVAYIIAVPVAWWASSTWLAEFAYAIDLGAGVFLTSAAVVTVLAMVSVVGQTARAAALKPVEAIRSE